jgi:GrpB-like predicted nucleotidyltransferase (UPF0157 family)
VADQYVAIADYDPAWADRFAEQQVLVEGLLRPWLSRPVEHIGSTSVPGLRAKPVIDMLAPVGSLDEARAALPVLADEARTHHLHVVEAEHTHARALLAFRDALRVDAGLRREYASVKERLARQHRDNRNAYTNAKTAFVERALRRAGIDPSPRDLLPE